MVLQSSGTISIANIANEYNVGLSNISFITASINPNKSTNIQMSNWYGKGKTNNYGSDVTVTNNYPNGANYTSNAFAYTTLYTFTPAANVGYIRFDVKHITTGATGTGRPFVRNDTMGILQEVYDSFVDGEFWIFDVSSYGTFSGAWSLQLFGLIMSGSVTEQIAYRIYTRTYSTSLTYPV